MTRTENIQSGIEIRARILAGEKLTKTQHCTDCGSKLTDSGLAINPLELLCEDCSDAIFDQ